MDGVDPVANLSPSDQGEHLVGRQVEGMQGQAEVGMLDEREESVGAVVGPLDERAPLAVAHDRLHERGALPDDLDRQPGLLQRRAIASPRRRERSEGVMEQVDVARPTGPGQHGVQGSAARDVALAGGLPLGG